MHALLNIRHAVADDDDDDDDDDDAKLEKKKLKSTQVKFHVYL